MTSVLFEAWRGRYADSPRAVSDQLAGRREVGRRWVTAPGTALPAGVHAVPRRSAAYFYRLSTASYLFTNDIITKPFGKTRRTTYVQCWHGTPLKAIGHDESTPSYSGAEAHRRRMDADVRRWDYLVSSSPDCTRIFRQAFRYEGPVLETGLPRNDVLALDQGAVRDRVRGQLGLAPETTAVLYAPTWRDDSKDHQGRFFQPATFAPEHVHEALGGQTVILSRLHKNVARREEPAPGAVVDVTDHPDIAELYLAADVLVSDYSSAVFDFAVTGKPVILHAPDLTHYSSNLRPLYFDYESWAPGPVTRSTDELVDCLRDLDAVAAGSANRYASFRRRFCPYDDGRATERLLAAVLPDR